MLKFTKTDSKKEAEGTWLDYDDGLGGILKLKIARSDGNPHYEATLTRLMAPHRKAMEKGKSIDNKVAKRIMINVLAKEILLGWDENALLGDDGNPTPYSEEAAVELLTSDSDLHKFVSDQAEDQTNFLIQKK